MLAAMCECCQMSDCCVGEEDYGEGRNVLLEVSQLLDLKRLVPANVDENFDAAVELEEGLGGAAGRLGAGEGCEVEHGNGAWASSQVYQSFFFGWRRL